MDHTPNALTSTELSAAEAVFGFMAWLTTRNSTLTLGAHHDCGGVSVLVDEFIKANNLGEIRDTFHEALVMPPEVLNDVQVVNPLNTLRQVFAESPAYTQTWFNSIAKVAFDNLPAEMAFGGASPTHVANKIASEFMKQTFDIKIVIAEEMSKSDESH